MPRWSRNAAAGSWSNVSRRWCVCWAAARGSISWCRGSPLPAFDVHCPLLDLPRLYQTTLATVPFNVPYVFADPQLVETWGRELGGGAALKIGIGWQGNPQFPGDALRSMPLRHFAALSQREGVRLFSLQKGAGREQLAPVLNFHITDLGGRLDEAAGPFMDTAAVMMNLDLVVTSDTAIAHLAGALGVPVWVALAVGADLRFLVEREDSPWYPTMRLFRQKRPHEWDEAFERIAAALPVRAATLSPATVVRTWGATLDHYQSGRRAEAEQGARQVVAAEPCHAEMLNLLGVLAHQAAQHDVAAERLRQPSTWLRTTLAFTTTWAWRCKFSDDATKLRPVIARRCASNRTMPTPTTTWGLFGRSRTSRPRQKAITVPLSSSIRIIRGHIPRWDFYCGDRTSLRRP